MINKLPISELEPGMITASPITDNRGRIIIPENIRLTPMHINRLSKWGIMFVRVKYDNKEEEKFNGNETKTEINLNTNEKEFMRRLAAKVVNRFKNLPETELNKELRRLAIKHLVLNGRGIVPGLNELTDD